MARRELSTTLKNLKFMQRATQKEENAKQAENLKPESAFLATSSPAPVRRCVVIVEGDPNPGAIRGRMSFQSFNPSIDKLNEEAIDTSEKRASSTVSNQNGGTFQRVAAAAVKPRDASPSPNSSDMELKRKQPEEGTSIRDPQKMMKVPRSNIDEGQTSSARNSKGPIKQKRHGKLDWSVLRPPKPNKS